MTTKNKKQYPIAAIIRDAGDGKRKIEVASRDRLQTILKKVKPNTRVTLNITLSEENRTGQQNRALHLWCQQVAEALNEAGYTVQMVLAQKVDIDFTKDIVKDMLWKTAQEALLKKKSTTELKKTGDIDKVYDHLNRHLAEKFSVHVPWPSMEVGYADTAPLLSDYKKEIAKKKTKK